MATLLQIAAIDGFCPGYGRGETVATYDSDGPQPDGGTALNAFGQFYFIWIIGSPDISEFVRPHERPLSEDELAKPEKERAKKEVVEVRGDVMDIDTLPVNGIQDYTQYYPFTSPSSYKMNLTAANARKSQKGQLTPSSIKKPKKNR